MRPTKSWLISALHLVVLANTWLAAAVCGLELSSNAYSQETGSPTKQIQIGCWKITAEQADGGRPRVGTLVIARNDKIGSTGYIDWNPSDRGPRTIEYLLAYMADDQQSVFFEGFRTESLGASWPPASYHAQLGSTPNKLIPLTYVECTPGSVDRSWTAKWIGPELPPRSQEIKSIEDLGTWRLGLQLVSSPYRINGTGIFAHPKPIFLYGLVDGTDEFIRGVAKRQLASMGILDRFFEKLDTSDLAQRFADDLRGAFDFEIAKWFLGQSGDYNAFMENLTRADGVIASEYLRQLEVIHLQLQGYAADYEMRKYLRENFKPAVEREVDIEPASISVDCVADGQAVICIAKNTSPHTLRKVILATEFEMDSASVLKQIKRRGGQDPLLPILAEALGADPQLMMNAQAVVWAKGAVLAAPVGNCVYIDQWNPGATVEFALGPTMLALMECASRGSVWVGADEAIISRELDLSALRKPILEWDAKGRPARNQRKPSEFYRDQNTADKDAVATPASASGLEKQAQDMLDLGRLFLNSGLLERGKSTLEELILKYPDSEASKQAKRQLAGLDGKPR